MFDKIIGAIERLTEAINRACDLYEKRVLMEEKNPFATKDGLFNYKQAQHK